MHSSRIRFFPTRSSPCRVITTATELLIRRTTSFGANTLAIRHLLSPTETAMGPSTQATTSCGARTLAGHGKVLRPATAPTVRKRSQSQPEWRSQCWRFIRCPYIVDAVVNLLLPPYVEVNLICRAPAGPPYPPLLRHLPRCSVCDP